MQFNRRKFLYYSTFSSLALACNTKARPQIDTKDKLGIALVGLGSYSWGQLAPALQLTKHCYLAGIVTGSLEKIPIWQQKYGIKDSNVYNYENMHTIADNDEIDVVYVVVPTALHAKYSIIAANAGKHVWCEKPMAMTVEACRTIIDACTRNKRKLCIGYRMQHEPNTKRVIEYAKTKPYGEFQHIQSEAGYRGGGGMGWRHQKAMGGGALYDMGVYTVNGIRYATGLEPTHVISARQYVNRPELFKEVDETTEYQLGFENGLIAYGKTSVGENTNILRIDCEQGWYELSPMQAYNGVQGKTSDGKLLNIFIESQQAQQMDDNALAIINNTPVLVPGEEGLRDIRIIQAIIEAHHTKGEVRITDG